MQYKRIMALHFPSMPKEANKKYSTRCNLPEQLHYSSISCVIEENASHK